MIKLIDMFPLHFVNEIEFGSCPICDEVDRLYVKGDMVSIRRADDMKAKPVDVKVSDKEN